MSINNVGEEIVTNCQYCKSGLSQRELFFMSHLCAEMPLMKAVDRQVELQKMFAESDAKYWDILLKKSYKEMRNAKILFWIWIIFLIALWITGDLK